MEKRFVYADNAATTPVTPAVLEAMTPWLMENYGNPSSIYSIGRAARTAVEKARRQKDRCRHYRRAAQGDILHLRRLGGG